MNEQATSETKEAAEQVTWAADGGSYTIRRGKESQAILCATQAEKWAERKAQLARGYGFCVEKRPRGWATWYAPLGWLREVGRDYSHGESLPRHERVTREAAQW